MILSMDTFGNTVVVTSRRDTGEPHNMAKVTLQNPETGQRVRLILEDTAFGRSLQVGTATTMYAILNNLTLLQSADHQE